MAAPTAAAAKGKAARCLFGRPEPGEQVSRQLQDNLNRMHAEDSRRWNFDFVGGVPLVGAHGDFQFESVAAADVPDFYRERTAHARKTIRRRESSPFSDTVEVPDEQLFVMESPTESEPQLLAPSTSKNMETTYEKPVTRSSTVSQMANEQQEVAMLKQTKLTNYMPVRKRRSETCLAAATASLGRSVSSESTVASQKEKRGKMNNNKGAPKRPLRFVSSNTPKPSSSVSDTAITAHSPPPKKMSSRRARRATGAGDF
ncbi:unnamed protein product [Caenorhabditis sp. 36 PRJEB53466]|nr:unnamed protein product [Caenorhabditis sp. 36 PRJEB53466]